MTSVAHEPFGKYIRAAGDSLCFCLPSKSPKRVSLPQACTTNSYPNVEADKGFSLIMSLTYTACANSNQTTLPNSQLFSPPTPLVTRHSTETKIKICATAPLSEVAHPTVRQTASKSRRKKKKQKVSKCKCWSQKSPFPPNPIVVRKTITKVLYLLPVYCIIAKAAWAIVHSIVYFLL